MSKRMRHFVGGGLATIGLGLFMLEVAFHVIAQFTHTQYELNEAVLILAGLLGFLGFYMIEPKNAKDAADSIVGYTERIARSLPTFGRRKTDPIGVPTVDAHPIVPMTPTDTDTAERQGAPKPPASGNAG